MRKRFTNSVGEVQHATALRAGARLAGRHIGLQPQTAVNDWAAWRSDLVRALATPAA